MDQEWHSYLMAAMLLTGTFADPGATTPKREEKEESRESERTVESVALDKNYIGIGEGRQRITVCKEQCGAASRKTKLSPR